LLRSDKVASTSDRVMLIDYEFCGYNYRLTLAPDLTVL